MELGVVGAKAERRVRRFHDSTSNDARAHPPSLELLHPGLRIGSFAGGRPSGAHIPRGSSRHPSERGTGAREQLVLAGALQIKPVRSSLVFAASSAISCNSRSRSAAASSLASYAA